MYLVGACKFYCLGKFQLYNTASSTVVIILNILFSDSPPIISPFLPSLLHLGLIRMMQDIPSKVKKNTAISNPYHREESTAHSSPLETKHDTLRNTALAYLLGDRQTWLGPPVGKGSAGNPDHSRISPATWVKWSCKLHGIRDVSGGKIQYGAYRKFQLENFSTGPLDYEARLCHW